MGRLAATRRWSGRRGSNPRLRPWQGRALPLSYSRPYWIEVYRDGMHWVNAIPAQSGPVKLSMPVARVRNGFRETPSGGQWTGSDWKYGLCGRARSSSRPVGSLPSTRITLTPIAREKNPISLHDVFFRVSGAWQSRRDSERDQQYRRSTSMHPSATPKVRTYRCWIVIRARFRSSSRSSLRVQRATRRPAFPRRACAECDRQPQRLLDCA